MSELAAPALRYFGGKFKLAAWITSHFPEHDIYVEPFGGAASVLLQKDPAYLDVYNDIDQGVVTFFRVLRDRPDELIRAISLTPYAREEFRLSQKNSDDELEMARRCYVRFWQGFAGKANHSGWRFQATRSSNKPLASDMRYDHLLMIAERLRRVQIESDEGLHVIGRYDGPDTLFYVDPPYLPRSRFGSLGAYVRELTEQEHIELAKMLNEIKGMAVLSGYDSDLYNELYPKWLKVSKRSHNVQKGKSILEYLWISPNAQTKMPRMF